jgi:hypothetical protein
MCTKVDYLNVKALNRSDEDNHQRLGLCAGCFAASMSDWTSKDGGGGEPG